MDKTGKTRKVYNFSNTCCRCFNDIEYPLLGDFSYGEMLFQTSDGQDFFMVELIENKTYDFIIEFLRNNSIDNKNYQVASKMLALIADKINNKEFTTEFPICPKCRRKQYFFTDDNRTTVREIGFASWDSFEKLTTEEKLGTLKEIVVKYRKLLA